MEIFTKDFGRILVLMVMESISYQQEEVIKETF
jgi:hypothetical protein